MNNKISKCCEYPIIKGNCGMCGKEAEERDPKPFYIVKWDVKLICEKDKNIEDFEIIKTLDKSLNFDTEILKIDSKYYRKCSLDFKLNYLSVEECKKPQELEELDFKDEICCPHCGYEQSDSWEASDSGDEECQSCGSKYFYERSVEVSYSMKITKRNNKIKEL